MVYPTENVIHIATECANRDHSAAFPVELPDWFIKLFTEPGDLVLDPFIGSGTTAVAAFQLGRNYLGIEINPEYIELTNSRLSEQQMRIPQLGEEKEEYKTKIPQKESLNKMKSLSIESVCEDVN